MGLAAARGAPGELRRERAAFLTGHDVSPIVRPEVVESWRRSTRRGVVPDHLDLHYSPELDAHSELCRAALPVLDHLAERLDTSRTALVLADEHAGILARWAGDSTVLAALDGVEAVPGVHLDERRAGTNGLGTTIELDRPTVISGAEHYADRYQTFTCAGVPIHHPLDGRALGVLDLVCPDGDANGLMIPVVAGTVDEIRRRLLELVTGFDRVLLERFLVERRSRRDPLVVLGGEVVLANTAATRVLHAADHDLLRRLTSGVGGDVLDAEVTLSAGTVVRLQGEPVTDVPGRVGWVLDVDIVSDGCDREASGGRKAGAAVPAAPMRHRPRRSPGTADELDDAGGYSRAWQRTLVDARRHAGFDLPVLVHGEEGSGKLTLLQAMWRRGGRPGTIRVADAALLVVDGPVAFLGRLRSWLAEPGGLVVLRHLHVLGRPEAVAVTALLDEVADTDVHLAATATCTGGEDGLDVPLALRDRVGVASVTVPPLRDRRPDIPLVIDRLRQHHPAIRALTPATVDALVRADWPGNVRQLRNVLLRAAAARPGGLIEVDDLPFSPLQSARRPLTHLEQLEMTAIVTHLRETGGNKLEAAANLGISRSTLYRKIRAYGIDA